jgi:hypothetical protein
MRNILKRLFVKLPLIILFFVACATGILPILYWVLTGGNCIELLDYVDNI